MEEKLNNTTPVEEEEGLDIMAMVRDLWKGRRTIIICTVIFLALGIVSALFMKRIYTVQTVMVPQMGNNKSGLGGLASLAGLDMGFNSSNGELTPLAYPQIVNSVPFRLELMHTPFHFQKCDTLISMYDYAEAGYEKPTVLDYVKRYTIGLPGVIMSALRGEEKEVVYYSDSDTAGNNEPRPLVLSKKEDKMQQAIGQAVTLDVDKKEGFITLSVTASEPLLAAEMALKAQRLLQDEVTRFRIEKSQSELEYIQARFNEIKAENDRNQGYLAVVTDRTQNVATQRATVEKTRVQSKYNVSNAIFLELAKQLEQAKMQVKKDTPVFTVIQPVTVPNKAANSRAKKVVIWTFLGIVLGCGIVLIKGYWPKLMEKLKNPETEAEESKDAHNADADPEGAQKPAAGNTEA